MNILIPHASLGKTVKVYVHSYILLQLEGVVNFLDHLQSLVDSAALPGLLGGLDINEEPDRAQTQHDSLQSLLRDINGRLANIEARMSKIENKIELTD